MYDYCFICNEQIQYGKQLINGKLYHDKCYEGLIKKIESINQKINNHDREIWNLRSEIDADKSLLNKLKRIFIGEDENKIQRKYKRIDILKSEMDDFKNERNSQKYKLGSVYDFWPDYPPDWEARKAEIYKQCIGCNICNSDYDPLHVHHKIPVSRGGNHKMENLILLCEDCHRRKHGGREFTYTDNVRGTAGAFISVVNLLKSAISQNKYISFHYTRFDGGKSVRSIKPYHMKEIQNSLCVVGYCYLRKEERTFAIRRMKQIRIIEVPGKSYRSGDKR